jgi:hypothetical protein
MLGGYPYELEESDFTVIVGSPGLWKQGASCSERYKLGEHRKNIRQEELLLTVHLFLRAVT